MRHKGSISHINLERDKIVPQLYRQAIKLVQWPADTMTVCTKAASLPVNEFYISNDAAVEYVRNRFYRNKLKQFRSTYKQKLYDALYEKFIQVVNLPENSNKPIPEIVTIVLASKAPCSGLTPLQLYYTMLKHKKRK